MSDLSFKSKKEIASTLHFIMYKGDSGNYIFSQPFTNKDEALYFKKFYNRECHILTYELDNWEKLQ